MPMNTAIQEKFKKAFVQNCFQLISDAFKISLCEKVIRLNWDENDISSELHRKIKENPSRLKWKISTNVESHISKNTAKTKGFSSKFPRIDFRLTTFVSEYEYEYFFEAKNLKQTNSSLKRKYIKTGINNFVYGKYLNGSLLGYLLEGKIDKTIKGINSLLIKDNRSLETLDLLFNKLHDAYYESNHSGIGKLSHFIFDFTTLNK